MLYRNKTYNKEKVTSLKKCCPENILEIPVSNPHIAPNIINFLLFFLIIDIGMIEINIIRDAFTVCPEINDMYSLPLANGLGEYQGLNFATPSSINQYLGLPQTTFIKLVPINTVAIITSINNAIFLYFFK